LVGAAAIASGLCAATAAPAAVQQFNLTYCSSGCASAAGDNVTVTEEGGGATEYLHIVATLFGGDYFNATNGLDALVFSLAGGPTITVSNLSPTSAFSVVTPQLAASNHEDGLGTFEYTIQNNDPSNARDHQSVSFDVSATGGLSLASL